MIDGKAIADDAYDWIARELKGADPMPVLGIVVASHDPVIESFVRIKTRAAARLGVELRRIDFLNEPTTGDVIAAIEKLAANAQGIIVQLPLLPGLDQKAILEAIPPPLDVDALNPSVVEAARAVQAPVAEAVREILARGHVEVAGKKCVVVGSGALVGAPAAAMLRTLGGIVSVVTLEEGTLGYLADADIIVSGAGSPGLIKPEMIKEGCVLIDAGTSELASKLAGDADPSCAGKCSLFTPVPGGVGPIAVAMIFKNLLRLCE